ncbi:HlyD family efflux transporter periplasmic adaptor subunit [Mesorhizobium sp. M2A.F.Ca.ET.037.01.1.1]|uniref:HlyD family secretion protein n=3 Tax=Mesorhizobium TaxID=68287 RepID=UPI000F75E3C0|nr:MULTISPECIES: HlyD family secretion protein [unclassified Mesorhizobium]RUY06554.1 HlyD family efflux transporter periplasmic adaptor subunit [Mesorhizobium sp. M2A.F.Ca.ET.040.01.1.1]RVC68210.1 HlyD family efflux transporter periplasmic adaptor subunit [Mesorhizobium sp. M00.F.Ca.ET.038.03.1.1]RVC73011.1 HlyD family efflux transporter periplasmic adaptor subunit [Mesorhizobium sp. M2A.F.Ca.ET.046.02.1.1]AZO38939.1 HlyD family secretion protein [Mesorhizobium sp. M2A.F.Ca.ET.046.03.2.1]RUX2
MSAAAKREEDNVTKLNAPAQPVAEAPAQPASAPVAVAPAPVAPKKKRRLGRFLLMVALPLALLAGGSYVWVTGGRYQETENANLQQARISVASDTAGRIVQVGIADNQLVKQGDLLFVIDPEPYRIALAQADAAVAAARLNVEQLRAAYSQAMAQEKSASSEVDYAQSQYDRAADLAQKGINAKSSLDQARNDLDKAKQQLAVAQQGIVSAKAALGGNPEIETDQHPTVMAALAARDKAAYDLAQTTVKAPADGVIYQAASFKVGQYVSVGTPLFALVETGDTWIDANFKETQLTNMKPGQKAEIVVDTYPGRTFEATVTAIGAGTGAEFSLLPAQNATGNWVKVTQRIPVRLELTDPDAKMALRTGMSATVTVDTGVARGLPSIFGHATAGEHAQ